MKILTVLGGTLVSSEVLIKGFKERLPMILQKGIDGKGVTPFADHEISVVVAEEAIDAYLENSPDRLVFVGTFSEAKNGSLAFILAQRILTRNVSKKSFLFTNPIPVPPFHLEDNFFLLMDTEGMSKWLGL